MQDLALPKPAWVPATGAALAASVSQQRIQGQATQAQRAGFEQLAAGQARAEFSTVSQETEHKERVREGCLTVSSLPVKPQARHLFRFPPPTNQKPRPSVHRRRFRPPSLNRGPGWPCRVLRR